MVNRKRIQADCHGLYEGGKVMEFKLLILPADLNDTPNGEDLILLVSREEFLRMWERGRTMVQNLAPKGQKIHGQRFAGSAEVS